jgi:hypothetical protein
MPLRRTRLLAALATTTAALAAGAPAAGAAIWPPAGAPTLRAATWPITFPSFGTAALPIGNGNGNAAGPCGTISNEGQGRASGNEASVCSGIGALTFIGPSTALSSVVGPTIISPGFVGTVITATGNVAVTP